MWAHNLFGMLAGPANSTVIDWNNGDECMILSKHLMQLLREGTREGARLAPRAAMACPVSEDDAIKVIKDMSGAIVDYGVRRHSPDRSLMQVTLRRRWQLLKQLLVKKVCKPRSSARP